DPKARWRGVPRSYCTWYDGSTGNSISTVLVASRQDWDVELASISGSLLILGNPPWVTNSTVASLNGSNLPVKENFQGFRGIEARTGKSNFDISEWMLIRLVRALRGRPATIAMLCKSGTARKLLRYAWQNDGRIAEASIYRIDAKKHFSAAVDA